MCRPHNLTVTRAAHFVLGAELSGVKDLNFSLLLCRPLQCPTAYDKAILMLLTVRNHRCQRDFSASSHLLPAAYGNGTRRRNDQIGEALFITLSPPAHAWHRNIDRADRTAILIRDSRRC